MGKRTHPDDKDDYYENIEKKVKKLNRMLLRARRKRQPSSTSDSSTSDSESSGESTSPRHIDRPSSPVTLCIQGVPNEGTVPLPSTSSCIDPQLTSATLLPQPATSATVMPQPSTSTTDVPTLKATDPQPSTNSATTRSDLATSPELSEDLLKILGADPSQKKTYGKEIQADLAIRLQHLATSGLTREGRKELMDKYPPPSNCDLIDAPTLNPEVKAAIPEAIFKRDKGIEQKQKLLSSATACIAEALTMLMADSKNNTPIIQLMMDASKLLCDAQYSDSITRRNFVLFNLKKELKDQLQATKIDKMLFSEGLTDALKTAKAISKSGADMKIPTAKKPINSFPKNTQKNLNWRAAPPNQSRQKGKQRMKEPANRNRHDTSSRQLSRPAPTTRSRR